MKVFNLLIILEVRFKTFLNSDAFKGMAIKVPAPFAPRPEDRDQAKEVKKLNEELKDDEMFEELPGPNTIPE